MKKISEFFLSAWIPLVNAGNVSQDGWGTETIGQETNMSGTSIEQVLLNFSSWSITLIGILCVVVFVYAGFTYLTAQGENDKIQQAKKIMTYALVGVVVASLGLVIVKTVSGILGTGQNSTVSIQTKPIAELAKKAEKDGIHKAKLPKNTSLAELESALKNLKEGETISFEVSGSDKQTEGTSRIVAFRKESGKIKIIENNSQTINELKNNQASFNFINSAHALTKLPVDVSAPPGDNCTLNANREWVCGSGIATVEVSNTDLEMEEIRSLLLMILELLETNLPIISTIENPILSDNVCFNQQACIEAGGTFTGEIARPVASTDECFCVFNMTQPNPILEETDRDRCQRSGGTWFEMMDAPQYDYCSCPGDSEFAKAPHERTSYPKFCSGGSPAPTATTGPSEAPDNEMPSIEDETACKNAGGEWIRAFLVSGGMNEYCSCPKEKIISGNKCVAKAATPAPTAPTPAPAPTAQTKCTNSGGTWAFNPVPNSSTPQTGTCTCPTNKILKNQECVVDPCKVASACIKSGKIFREDHGWTGCRCVELGIEQLSKAMCTKMNMNWKCKEATSKSKNSGCCEFFRM